VVVLASPKYNDYVGKVQNFLRGEGYQVTTDDFIADPVFLWQMKAGARLPAVSGENRGTLSSDSLIDKVQVSAGGLKQTVVYDNAEGSKPFSLEDLTHRLNAQVSLFKESRAPADFVVILGENVGDIFQKDNGEFFLTDEGMEQEKAENGE